MVIDTYFIYTDVSIILDFLSKCFLDDRFYSSIFQLRREERILKNHINIWIKKTWKIITSVLYIVAGISRIWDVLDTSSFPVSFLMSLVFENKFVIENSCIGLMLYFINFITSLVFKWFDCIFNWLYQFWVLLA